MMSENAGRTRALNPLNNPVVGYVRRGSSVSSSSRGDRGNDRRGGRSDGNLLAWPAAAAAAAPAQTSPAFTGKNFSGSHASALWRSDVDMSPAASPGSTAQAERLEAVAAVTLRRVRPAGSSLSAPLLPPPPPLRLPPPPPLQRFAGVRPRVSGEPTSVSTAAVAAAFRFSASPATAVPCNAAAAASASEKRSLAPSCEYDCRRDSASIDDDDVSDSDLVVDVDDADGDGLDLSDVGVPLTAAQRLVAAAAVGHRGPLPTIVSAHEATSCASPAAVVACGFGYGQRIPLASSSHSSGSSSSGADTNALRGFAASGGGDGCSSSGTAGEQCTVQSASLGRVASRLLPPDVEKLGDDFDDDEGGAGDADFADFYDDDEWSDACDVSDAALFGQGDAAGGGVMALAWPTDDDGVQEKKRRRGKCGQCQACQIKVDCGRCRYCVHKRVLKQSCLMRKCRYLIHKDHLQRRASRLAAMRDRARASSGPMLSHSLFGSGGRHQPEAGLFEPQKQQQLQQQRLPPTPPLLSPALLLQRGRPQQPLSQPLQALSQQQQQQQSRLLLPRPAAPQIPSVPQSSRLTEPSPPIPALRRASAATTRPASPATVLCTDDAAMMTVMPYHAFIELPLAPTVRTCGLRRRRSRRANSATAAATAAAAAVSDEAVASAGLLSPPLKCELRSVPTWALEDPMTDTVARAEAKSGPLLLPYRHEQQQQQHHSSRQPSPLPLLSSPCQTSPLEAHPALTGRRRPRKSRSPRPLRAAPWEPNEATCDEDPAEDDAGDAGGSSSSSGGGTVDNRSLLCGTESGIFSASAASYPSASLLTTSCLCESENAGEILSAEQASGARAIGALEMRKRAAPDAEDDDALASRRSPHGRSYSSSSDRSDFHVTLGAVFGGSSSHSRGDSDEREQRLPCDLPEGVPSAPSAILCDFKAGAEGCRRLHDASLVQPIERPPSVHADDRTSENLRDAIGVGGGSCCNIGVADFPCAASGSHECSEVGGSNGADVCDAKEAHGASGVCGSGCDDEGADVSAAEGLSDACEVDCGNGTDVCAAERAFDERDAGSPDGVDVGCSKRLNSASCCDNVVVAAVARSRNFPNIGGSMSEACTAGEFSCVSLGSANGGCNDVGANDGSNVVSANGEGDNVGAPAVITAGIRRSFDSFDMDERDSNVGDDVSVEHADDEAGILSQVVAAAAADGGPLEGVPRLVLGPRNYEQEMALELKSAEFVTLSDEFSQAIFDRTFDDDGNSPLEASTDETPASHPVASDVSCVPGQGELARLGGGPMSRRTDVAAVGSSAANVALCDALLSDEILSPSVSIAMDSTVCSNSSSSSGGGSGSSGVSGSRLCDRRSPTSSGSRDGILNGCDNVAEHAATDRQTDVTCTSVQGEFGQSAFTSGNGLRHVIDECSAGLRLTAAAASDSPAMVGCEPPSAAAAVALAGESSSVGCPDDSTAARPHLANGEAFER